MAVKVLILEPFYGGSHKQLVDILIEREFFGPEARIQLLTLPAKKWHWRARTASLYFSQKLPLELDHDLLFCSSTLNLAEFSALKRCGSKMKKVVYFHENQLEYPVREAKERDFHYGYAQILTCLAADLVIFNSEYNKRSFLSRADSHFNLQPDFRPESVASDIEAKAKVLHFPVEIPKEVTSSSVNRDKLHVVWNHRWEHDKNPEAFFTALIKLKAENIPFEVSVLGQSFGEIPESFRAFKAGNGDLIANWGFLPDKADYWRILREEANVVVSTANHEFFGVSVLEAVLSGCFPLVPNRLVYPEIFPFEQCLYNTDQQLFKALRNFARYPKAIKDKRPDGIDSLAEKFSVQTLKQRFKDVLFH